MVIAYTKLLGHGVAFLLLGWLTYVSLTQEWIPILDDANLIFHEAGHAILFWAPEFVTVLGGTLGQLMVPALCAIAFWREQKVLSAQITLWWFGQNLANISVYIGDARAQVLPLLGGDGVGHDWHYVLGELHLLAYDELLGTITFFLAATMMVFAVAQVFAHLWEAYTHHFHR